jgi:hypothetical protein
LFEVVQSKGQSDAQPAFDHVCIEMLLSAVAAALIMVEEINFAEKLVLELS